MKTIILVGLALDCWVAVAATQLTVGWPETIDRLNEQRSQAEACVNLLRDSGDPTSIRKSRTIYGSAKAASDGVIAGFTVGLVEGYQPEKLPGIQTSLERAGRGLKEVCDAAVNAASTTEGTKGVVEDLAKGAVEPVIDGLKSAAAALWSRHLEMDKLEMETIKGQLEAAHWPEF